MTPAESPDLVERARAGDRTAYDRLIGPRLRPLRAVVRRMVGHAEDTDDVVQESLIKSWLTIGSAPGEASFETWLIAIGVREAIDHLRAQTRWRGRAQLVYADACSAIEELGTEVAAVLSSPEFEYRVKEHVAYCFTSVGRSLPPEQQGALVLRELAGLSDDEAARAMQMAEADFGRTLADARGTMEASFESVCSLVNEEGACRQCESLRESAAEGRRGEPIPMLRSFDDRLRCVREADVDVGRSQALHDLLWRRTKQIEDEGLVLDDPDSDSGRD